MYENLQLTAQHVHDGIFDSRNDQGNGVGAATMVCIGANALGESAMQVMDSWPPRRAVPLGNRVTELLALPARHNVILQVDRQLGIRFCDPNNPCQCTCGTCADSRVNCQAPCGAGPAFDLIVPSMRASLDLQARDKWNTPDRLTYALGGPIDLNSLTAVQYWTLWVESTVSTGLPLEEIAASP